MKQIMVKQYIEKTFLTLISFIKKQNLNIKERTKKKNQQKKNKYFLSKF